MPENNVKVDFYTLIKREVIGAKNLGVDQTKILPYLTKLYPIPKDCAKDTIENIIFEVYV